MTEQIPLGYALVVNRIQTPANEIASWSVGAEIAGSVVGQEAANNAFSQLKTSFQNSTDTNYTLLRTDLYVRSLTGELQLFQSTGAPVAGTKTANSSPTAVCYVARKRTQFVGRGYRGRAYLPLGVEESSVDEGGRVNASTITALTTVINGYWQGLSGVGGPFSDLFVFRHPRLNPGVNPPVYGEPEPIAITSWSIAPIVGIQRKRLPKA